MMRILQSAALAFALSLAACDRGGDAGAEPEHAGEEGHAEEEGGADRVTITNEAAEASEIALSVAGPGALRETLSLPGRIVLQPAARAELRASYPGPVRAVLRNIGDHIRRGEVLARVESAESLQTYSIVSPIAGVVLERAVSVGDVTAEDPLFVVGDLTRLQAELSVPTRDIGRVNSGQTVLIAGLDGATQVHAEIASVLPAADLHTQTLMARAPFTVQAPSAIRPGMAVRAAVVLAQEDVAIAVPADAVQSFEGRNVVFVLVADETYEARPVTVGRRGGDMVEIATGLAAGERYVSRNAFLVKAEIGKGEAGHGH
ncbi:MAG: efflux RND transporter periplasmic adaptor subunit [Vitreimonas sp.]